MPAGAGGRCRCISSRAGIVTNGVPELRRRKLAALRVGAAVEHVVVSGALGYGKPDPRIFHHALRMFRVPARACLMVGNSLEHDVAGARAAGVGAVWFAHEEIPGTPSAAATGVPPAPHAAEARGLRPERARPGKSFPLHRTVRKDCRTRP